MATLAPSLRNLFQEIDVRWPNRDRRTDGWIGDAAHQARESDHNPDSRGIVHAIDVDKDGIDTNAVIGAAVRDEMPTSYVIYNRQIWSRTRLWLPRPYTGSNPHTGHIHVSILHGATHESANIHWGLIDLGAPVADVANLGGTEEMAEWQTYFDRSGTEFSGAAMSLAQGASGLNAMMR